METKELLIIIIPSLFTLVAAILGALISTDRIIITNFLNWQKSIPRDFVILINGASGVGKTSIAVAIARKYNIPYVISSDIIREVLRKDIELKKDESRNIILESSYTAYLKYDKEINQNKVIDAFKEQSKIISTYTHKVIARILSKRDPVIIEGVNLVASNFTNIISTDSYSKVVFINIYLESKDLHCKRIRERGLKSLEEPSKTARYLDNINNIRSIDDYLRKDSQLYTTNDSNKISHLISLENSGSMSKSIKIISKTINKKIRFLKRNKLI